ncbi:MAG: hypothetical protein WCE64_13915 [Bacteroidales bacterium]
MKPILIAGTIIVNFALISYSLFIFFERKTKRAGITVVTFLTAGVLLDLTSTICMIAGSSNSTFTLHGILGYSSLLGMITDAVLVWRIRLKSRINGNLSGIVHKYSGMAFTWWIVAYITGALIVALR